MPPGVGHSVQLPPVEGFEDRGRAARRRKHWVHVSRCGVGGPHGLKRVLYQPLSHPPNSFIINHTYKDNTQALYNIVMDTVLVRLARSKVHVRGIKFCEDHEFDGLSQALSQSDLTQGTLSDPKRPNVITAKTLMKLIPTNTGITIDFETKDTLSLSEPSELKWAKNMIESNTFTGLLTKLEYCNYNIITGATEPDNIIAELKGFTHLTELSITEFKRLKDLKPLQSLKNLTHLSFSGFSKITDIKPLQSLENLTHLSFEGFDNLQDLGPLTKLTQLADLSIERSSVEDLKPLEELVNLERLRFITCKGITDLTPLEKLVKLSTLSLMTCPMITNLTPLEKLGALTALNLSDLKRVREFEVLEKLTTLTTLELAGLPFLKNLGPLQSLKKLTKLELMNMKDVEGLKELLSNLTELSHLTLFNFSNVEDIATVWNIKNASCTYDWYT